MLAQGGNQTIALQIHPNFTPENTNATTSSIAALSVRSMLVLCLPMNALDSQAMVSAYVV